MVEVAESEATGAGVEVSGVRLPLGNLVARLQDEGVTGTKSSSPKMTRQVQDFLKTRHDP